MVFDDPQDEVTIVFENVRDEVSPQIPMASEQVEKIDKPPRSLVRAFSRRKYMDSDREKKIDGSSRSLFRALSRRKFIASDREGNMDGPPRSLVRTLSRRILNRGEPQMSKKSKGKTRNTVVNNCDHFKNDQSWFASSKEIDDDDTSWADLGYDLSKMLSERQLIDEQVCQSFLGPSHTERLSSVASVEEPTGEGSSNENLSKDDTRQRAAASIEDEKNSSVASNDENLSTVDTDQETAALMKEEPNSADSSDENLSTVDTEQETPTSKKEEPDNGSSSDEILRTADTHQETRWSTSFANGSKEMPTRKTRRVSVAENPTETNQQKPNAADQGLHDPIPVVLERSLSSVSKTDKSQREAYANEPVVGFSAHEREETKTEPSTHLSRCETAFVNQSQACSYNKNHKNRPASFESQRILSSPSRSLKARETESSLADGQKPACELNKNESRRRWTIPNTCRELNLQEELGDWRKAPFVIRSKDIHTRSSVRDFYGPPLKDYNKTEHSSDEPGKLDLDKAQSFGDTRSSEETGRKILKRLPENELSKDDVDGGQDPSNNSTRRDVLSTAIRMPQRRRSSAIKMPQRTRRDILSTAMRMPRRRRSSAIKMSQRRKSRLGKLFTKGINEMEQPLSSMDLSMESELYDARRAPASSCSFGSMTSRLVEIPKQSRRTSRFSRFFSSPQSNRMPPKVEQPGSSNELAASVTDPEVYETQSHSFDHLWKKSSHSLKNTSMQSMASSCPAEIPKQSRRTSRFSRFFSTIESNKMPPKVEHPESSDELAADLSDLELYKAQSHSFKDLWKKSSRSFEVTSMRSMASSCPAEIPKQSRRMSRFSTFFSSTESNKMPLRMEQPGSSDDLVVDLTDLELYEAQSHSFKDLWKKSSHSFDCASMQSMASSCLAEIPSQNRRTSRWGAFFSSLQSSKMPLKVEHPGSSDELEVHLTDCQLCEAQQEQSRSFKNLWKAQAPSRSFGNLSRRSMGASSCQDVADNSKPRRIKSRWGSFFPTKSNKMPFKVEQPESNDELGLDPGSSKTEASSRPSGNVLRTQSSNHSIGKRSEVSPKAKRHQSVKRMKSSRWGKFFSTRSKEMPLKIENRHPSIIEGFTDQTSSRSFGNQSAVSCPAAIPRFYAEEIAEMAYSDVEVECDDNCVWPCMIEI